MGYNNSISYLKALGIVLMVIGHCTYEVPMARQVIYMFHMPIFFFVAGFCFKRAYLEHPQDFLWKRVKGLYWPFVKWGLVFLLLHNLFFRWGIYSEEFAFMGWVNHPYTWQETVWKAIQIVLAMREPEQMVGGYWFLNALFWASLLSWLLLRLMRSWLAALTALAVGLCMNRFGWYVPWLMIAPQALVSAFLFLVGHVFAEQKVRTFGVWQIVGSLVLMVVGSFFWRSDLDRLFYSTPALIPYLATAVLTVWSLYSLSERWGHLIAGNVQRAWLFVGNHTLTVLTFHFLSFKLVSLLIIIIDGLPIKHLGEYPVIISHARLGWWMVYAVVGVLVPLLGVWIEERLKAKQ